MQGHVSGSEDTEMGGIDGLTDTACREVLIRVCVCAYTLVLVEYVKSSVHLH